MMTWRRFWSHVKFGPDCWEWQPQNASTRYGTFKVSGHKWLAHRFSYTLARGPIPEGLNVLHRCDNGWCVRPDHLFLGTQTDNMRDMAAKGRGRSGHTKHQDCSYGHPLSGDNVHVNPNGMRQCKTCDRRRGAEYRARRRPTCRDGIVA